MSGAAKDGGTSRHVSDMQLVAAIPNSVGAVVAKAGTVDGSIVEYGKGAGGGSVLREEEEDLEVKLRRIIENVPVRVNNTSGSSAGSGSGDFHQYRQMRRKEQDRLMRMDADYERRKELAEFNMRREERLKAAEDRTAKKRAKRQKKKLKRKEKRSKVDHGDEHHPLHQEDDSSESEDSDDPHAQSRYSMTKAFVIAFFMTFFSVFDVPVFWPILLLYWLVLFTATMKRQILHMIKYRYVPFTFGKQRYNRRRAATAEDDGASSSSA